MQKNKFNSLAEATSSRMAIILKRLMKISMSSAFSIMSDKVFKKVAITCLLGILLLGFCQLVRKISFKKCSINLSINLFKASGYMEISLDQCEQVEANKALVDWSELRVKKLNKTFRGLTGNMSVNIDMGNDFLLGLNTYVKQGGEYRLSPFKMPPRPLCEVVEADVSYYNEIAAESNLPLPFSCPIKKVYFYFFQHSFNFINIILFLRDFINFVLIFHL